MISYKEGDRVKHIMYPDESYIVVRHSAFDNNKVIVSVVSDDKWLGATRIQLDIDRLIPDMDKEFNELTQI